MRQTKGALFLLLILAINSVNGQSTSSVYSDRGIGLINYQGLPNNMAMGEVGIAVPSIWNINYQNPAFLPFNNLMMFQVGLEMDRRSLENNEQAEQEVSAGLRYLNFAFPVISGKWTTSFGLTPYSTVNSKTFTTDSLNNNQTGVLTSFKGSGGLTSFVWSNGFKVSKALYVGVRMNYLFGSIEDRARSFISDTQGASYVVDFTDKSSYSGVGFELSTGYRKELNETSVLNFGAVYKLAQDLTGTNDKFFELVSNTGQGTEPRYVVEDKRISYTVPSSIGFGTSYQVFNKYLIGIDVKTTTWSSSSTETDSFVNTTKIGVGGEWTPDYGSVSKYLNRVTYRLGVSFENHPYKVNGQTIREFGINFGGSLPVGLSSLDLAFKYGGLGTKDNDLIRETYFRVVIGATINDRWFIKRRYD